MPGLWRVNTLLLSSGKKITTRQNNEDPMVDKLVNTCIRTYGWHHNEKYFLQVNLEQQTDGNWDNKS